MPNATRLPPLLFLPTSTAYSACCLAGLLHPAASHGVRGVSTTISRPSCNHDDWSLVPFPHSHLIPSEAFPLAAAVLCHHIRYLPAVPPVYCCQCADSRPQGFAPLQNPLPSAGIATRFWPDAPLGFVPLQGSPLIIECSLEGLRRSSAEADSLWSQHACAPATWIAPTEVSTEHERSRSSQRSYSRGCLPRHGWCRNTGSCRPADHWSACP